MSGQPHLPKVTAAAILWHGKVYAAPCPGRHGDVIRLIVAENPEASVPIVGTDGFVCDDGTFLGRRPAARQAIAAGQILETKWGDELFSEDLW